MPRPDGRSAGDLRPVEIIPGYQRHPAGSALIKCGETWVICAANVESKLPSFLGEEEHGWVTAEYAMLPGATHTRGRRAPGGRGKEIQRLIGRSLRAGLDMSLLADHTITVDCDVLQADGGTRCASITGAFVAIALAVARLKESGAIPADSQVMREGMAAVSVGIIDGEPRLDLPYAEDVAAEVDMNVVMTQSGRLVEVQGTAEKKPFSRRDLDQLLDLAQTGIGRLCEAQRRIVVEATGSSQW